MRRNRGYKRAGDFGEDWFDASSNQLLPSYSNALPDTNALAFMHIRNYTHICIHICIHVRMPVCTNTQTYIHPCSHACMHIRKYISPLYIYKCICILSCMQIISYTHTSIHLYMYIYVYICVYMFGCIYVCICRV